MKRVLCWHPQGWECKIHMGCNEISTDLAWEGNSHQRGNAEILKTFCYATGTFVSCRKAVVGLRAFIPGSYSVSASAPALPAVVVELGERSPSSGEACCTWEVF